MNDVEIDRYFFRELKRMMTRMMTSKQERKTKMMVTVMMMMMMTKGVKVLCQNTKSHTG